MERCFLAQEVKFVHFQNLKETVRKYIKIFNDALPGYVLAPYYIFCIPLCFSYFLFSSELANYGSNGAYIMVSSNCIHRMSYCVSLCNPTFFNLIITCGDGNLPCSQLP